MDILDDVTMQEVLDATMCNPHFPKDEEFYMCDELYYMQEYGDLCEDLADDARSTIAEFIHDEFSLHRYIMRCVFQSTSQLDIEDTDAGCVGKASTLAVRHRIYKDWENRQEILDAFVTAMRKEYHVEETA